MVHVTAMGAGGARNIQRCDGGGHQANRSHCHQAAERHARDAAGQAKARGFQKKGPQHAGAGGAERAQDADLLAAAHHRDRNRVVDQERTDDQGDVAQDPQIPAERGEHAAVLFGAGPLRREHDACRQGGAEDRFPLIDGAPGRHVDQNAVERCAAAEQAGGGGEIHNDGIRPRCRQCPARCTPPDSSLTMRRRRSPGRRPASLPVHMESLRWNSAAPALPAGRGGVRQHVHTDERDYAIGVRNHGIVLDAGSEPECVGQERQAGEGVGRDAAGRRHFEIAAAGEGLDRRAERPRSRFARQFDGEDHGDAERHRRDHQRGADRLAGERPQDEPVKDLQVRH